MSEAESSKLAIRLLRERSRDALVGELDTMLSTLEPEQASVFLADLLLAAGADRDHLRDRLAALLAARFGRSSEKSSPDQLDLFAQALRVVAGGASTSSTAHPEEARSEEALMAAAAELIEQTHADVEALAAKQRGQRKAAEQARRAAAALERAADGDAVPWPTHLPVRTETLPVPEPHVGCEDCGVERTIIRHETSWRLEYTTRVEVVVTRRPVVACRSHHGGPMTTPVPPKPVDGGQLGFGLAARLLWLRLTHNLPVRRLAEIMQAEGAPVSETMIHTLIEVSGERVKPVVEAILYLVQCSNLVNLDDTPTDVHEGHRERRRRRARVWLALGDGRFAYFFATKTWQTVEAEQALGPIQGVLQGDGYKGFPGYVDRNGVTLAGCMAHLRRKLRKAVAARDPRATQAMALVQGLYRVEELARLSDLGPEQRLALRQRRSVPIMAALIAWAKAVQPTIEKGSPLGQAWTYLSNQLGPLQVFLHDGAVSIDNNAAERGLRRITIGRKLWLFFRGQAKLEHVARLMSVVTTARLHGVDELAYLGWVLEQLARRDWSPKAARALLPDAWKAMQEQTQQIGAAQA